MRSNISNPRGSSLKKATLKARWIEYCHGKHLIGAHGKAKKEKFSERERKKNRLDSMRLLFDGGNEATSRPSAPLLPICLSGRRRHRCVLMPFHELIQRLVQGELTSYKQSTWTSSNKKKKKKRKKKSASATSALGAPRGKWSFAKKQSFVPSSRPDDCYALDFGVSHPSIENGWMDSSSSYCCFLF